MSSSAIASPTPQRLAGRRVLVTGAASGIGRTTARLLAAEGAAVALVDRDADGLAVVATELGAQAFPTDITDDASVAASVAAAAAALGGIDGVVNSAGIHLNGSVGDVAPDRFSLVLAVNVVGMYSVIRNCLPHLTQAEGSTVVNVASAQGLRPDAPNRTAYAASKGGVVALTRALAAELAPRIRVNAIAPGLVKTPMAAGIVGAEKNYALGRLAEPEEIARAIAFLTSSEASYITGATLAVDGGRSFH